MVSINIKSLLVIFAVFFSCLSWAQADETSSVEDSSAAVMSAFVEQSLADATALELTEETKHQILFIMGVLLIVLLAATAYFGISMALGGKNFFVQHMVCAALALTLSLAHAVTAVVWFFPF